jgi:hypothetical protein
LTFLVMCQHVTHLASRKHETWEEGASTTRPTTSDSYMKVEGPLLPSTSRRPCPAPAFALRRAQWPPPLLATVLHKLRFDSSVSGLWCRYGDCCSRRIVELLLASAEAAASCSSLLRCSQLSGGCCSLLAFAELPTRFCRNSPAPAPRMKASCMR